MIFAVPFFFPVTTPLEDTVAIFLLDEIYFTVPVGVAVALIVVFFPTLMLAEVLASFNVGVFTVTVQVALYSPHVAVITAVPLALAVTTPLLFTVATFLLLELHVI